MPSSAWNYITPLCTVQTFKLETDNGWGRSHLKRIDKQLERAHMAWGNETQYVGELGRLLDECREWMIGKTKKFARKAPSLSYEKRLAAVTSLMGQVMLQLKHFAFEMNKASGQKRAVVELQPGYDRERQEFEQMKNDHPWNDGLRLDPHSGSFVTAGVGDLQKFPDLLKDRPWSPEIDGIFGKTVAEMSDEEFLAMSQELKRLYKIDLSMGGFYPRVHYIRKSERISNNMLLPIGGLLYKDSGYTPYSTHGPSNKELYSIDRYGNLMTAPADEAYGESNFQSEYRHSSMNAGNAVMCAGYVQIMNGAVHYLDNKSGHYRPTEKDLARAVVVLMNEMDLDLSKAMITSISGPLHLKGVPFFGGQAFLSAVLPPPPQAQAY